MAVRAWKPVSRPVPNEKVSNVVQLSRLSDSIRIVIRILTSAMLVSRCSPGA